MSDRAIESETSCEAVVAAADYPVFVVTTQDGAEKAGCLVGFTTQISIDPLRFLIGVSKKNHTFGIAMRAKRLAVHLLRPEDKALAALFGGRTEDTIDKFARCAWQPGPDGVPILTAAAGWFSGPVIERHDFGDHMGMLLAPDSGADPASEADVLRFSMVADLRPGHEA
ncbi:flavin reductase family protein [Nocardia higoensis]|uniref:flavin reductase family protein n=1 Tax=Nocardia higoensis TaxID=228599 RepID=UPI0002FF7598|nr:flavin reductase family protein [Nocardia higoensis]